MFARSRSYITPLLGFAWAMSAGYAFAQENAVVPWDTLKGVSVSIAPSGEKTLSFSSVIHSLDKKTVTVKGFRVPLEVRAHFLLAAKPTDCPFHIDEDGAETYVDVYTKEPVAPTFGKPVTLTGTLHVLRDDSKGMYYRLVDAQLVPLD